MRASFLSFILCAILATYASIMFFINYNNMSNEAIIMSLFLMSIVWSMHTMHHYYEEIYFDFNPLVGKWAIHDQKTN